MMKILHSVRALAFTGLLASLSPALNAQWSYLGTPGFSTGTGTYQSMALGSDGTLYVAYNDQGLGASGSATVMKYNGSAWVPVGTPGFTASTAEYGSLAVGSGDTLYFSYQDGPSGQCSVMKFNGINWVQVGSPGISTGTATYTCMEVSLGDPIVAYIDGSTNRACVQYFNGTNWVPLGSSIEVSPGSADYLSMDLDNSSFPWIGFADGNSANNTTVMYWSGSSWQVAGTAGFSNSLSGVIFMDFTIGNDGNPYVAYANPFAGVTGNVQKFDGITWDTVGTAGFTTSSAIFNTVTVAFDGTPYMAFMDNSVPGSKGSVMKYDGATPSWNYLGPAGFTGSGAGYLNSLLDGNTFLYVSNSDGDYGGRTSVMRYQLCDHADHPIVSAPASVCEGDSITLSLSGSINDDLNWHWSTISCLMGTAGTGPSITVAVSDTVTYYINGVGTCEYAGDSCASITINPYATPAVPTFTIAGATLTSSSATGNQWALNGTDIPGATGQNFSVTTAGWYTVTVTNANGCSATSDSVLVTSTTGMPEQEGPQAHVYPVPFGQVLNIDLVHNGVCAISVSDAQGRTVFTGSLTQTSNSIDLSELVNGVYYVTLEQNQVRQICRIVKQ